ncbi:hypothetical protein [Streptomyces sp. NPDC001815]|uniref:tetratricopeptide repeat protein n=1 Tax=Streptomyces sp. NPDC001815 TaxID=3154526 RepID=UPI00331AB021
MSVWSWVLDDGLDQEMVDLAGEFRSLSPESIDQRCDDLAQDAAEGDLVPMQRYAMALVHAGRVEDSSRVWWALAQRHPTSLVGWLNLAFALVRSGRPDAATNALKRARERLAEDPVSVAALDTRAQELREARAEQRRALRLIELQAAAARERLTVGADRPGDRFRLARLLYGLLIAEGGSVTLDEALAAAKEAHAEDCQSRR